MEFERQRAGFESFGYRLAALAVDPPERSAKLQLRLGLSFPLLCDPGRDIVRAWDLYNAREHGGIAAPATAVIAGDGMIRLLAREGMAQRLRALELLRYLSTGAAPAPARRGFWPKFSAWWRACMR